MVLEIHDFVTKLQN